MLVVIPRGVVFAESFLCELVLGEADTILTALVGADGSLASNTFVVGKASALTSLSIANTLVGAFYYGVGVVGVVDISYPGLVLGASPARAVSAGPLGLAIDSLVALAPIVGTATSVARAAVGAVGSNNCKKTEKYNQYLTNHFMNLENVIS